MEKRKGTLEGKVAIVTGGGTGLGKTMALAMAKEGADVVVASRRLEAIGPAAKEITRLGVRGLAIQTDVTDSAQVNRLIERTISEMGGLNILINNAGIVRGQKRKEMWDITDEEWHLGININLTGTFYCCRAAAKYFLEHGGGKIINIASGNGLRGSRDDYMYGTAKAGVINLSRILAITFAQNNIQVNCIAPGFIDVRAIQPIPITTPLGRNPDLIPVGRFGVPEDIGCLGLFLASDASNYISGVLFANDGGGLAGGCTPTGFAPVINFKED